MPPSVACALVDTSTGNHSPCRRSCALRPSSTTPGCTTAVAASLSKETMLSRNLLWSMTSAAPTVWPHCELPAPRGRTGTPSSTAICSAIFASCSVFGTTTPTGSIW